MNCTKLFNFIKLFQKKTNKDFSHEEISGESTLNKIILFVIPLLLFLITGCEKYKMEITEYTFPNLSGYTEKRSYYGPETQLKSPSYDKILGDNGLHVLKNLMRLSSGMR